MRFSSSKIKTKCVCVCVCVCRGGWKDSLQYLSRCAAAAVDIVLAVDDPVVGTVDDLSSASVTSYPLKNFIASRSFFTACLKKTRKNFRIFFHRLIKEQKRI